MGSIASGDVLVVYSDAIKNEALLGNNEKVLELGNQACSMFPVNDNYIEGYTYLYMAGAYYSKGQFEKTVEYTKKGIPIYIDAIKWGFDDDIYAKILAASYKITYLSYEELDDKETYELYKQTYEEYIWFRELSDEDINDLLSSLHWIN